jgi:hypothetical protein
MHSGRNNRSQAAILKFVFLFTAALILNASAQDTDLSSRANHPTTITNLLQLTRSLNHDERVICGVDIEAVVCAASESSMGVAILQDETGVELVELGSRQPQISPGQKIRIKGARCLLRRRDLGVEFSGAPLVDNDGIHGEKTVPGEISLKKGRHPLQLDWFN